jgi:membrane protein
MIRAMPRPLTALLDLGLRSFARFVELEGFDRAMALAGQAFAALLPLLIVIGSVSPTSGDDLADALTSRFKLDQGAAKTLGDLVAQPPDPGIGVLGAVLLVISALSFTRALQRLYVRAWRLGSLGLRGNVWGLEWLAAFGLYWALQPTIVHLFDGLLGFVASLALSTALWIVTPWLLVARRVPWRRLLPQALLTVVGLDALAIAGAIYLPRAVESASREFGVLGVAFTLLSLLFAFSLVLVATAALGASLADPPARDAPSCPVR